MKLIYSALGMVSIVSTVEAFALYFLRAGGLQNLLIASFIYGGGVVPLLSNTLKYEGIGIVNFLWNILSTLFGFGIGIYMFGEQIHYLQVIGVALSMLGVGLIIMAPKSFLGKSLAKTQIGGNL